MWHFESVLTAVTLLFLLYLELLDFDWLNGRATVFNAFLKIPCGELRQWINPLCSVMLLPVWQDLKSPEVWKQRSVMTPKSRAIGQCLLQGLNPFLEHLVPCCMIYSLCCIKVVASTAVDSHWYNMDNIHRRREKNTWDNFICYLYLWWQEWMEPR